MLSSGVCLGVFYRRFRKPYESYYPQSGACLPVRLRLGTTTLVPWGRPSERAARLTTPNTGDTLTGADQCQGPHRNAQGQGAYNLADAQPVSAGTQSALISGDLVGWQAKRRLAQDVYPDVRLAEVREKQAIARSHTLCRVHYTYDIAAARGSSSSLATRAAIMSRSFILIACVILTACATTFKVVQLPLRNADLYPLSQTKGSVTVAVDEISNPERVNNYFGVDLLEAGIIPINVVVSNHGPYQYTIKPADILLLRHTEVIDPLPIEQITAIVKDNVSLSDETSEQVDQYFADLAFTETVLIPHDSYQGVLFFPVLRSPPDPDTMFEAIVLFKQSDLKLHVVTTNLNNQERVEFGPFPLTDWPSYTEGFID
jgi:hypothetical protein